MDQSPVPNIGINRQMPRLDANDPGGIEKYITDVVGNYFNAAFTKTPYFPPQWGAQETDMLARALNEDPSLALRMSQEAYARATSVKLANTVNPELDKNVKEAINQGLPPFVKKGQETVIGPVKGFPANGIDYVNGIYNNSLNNKNQAANSGEAVTYNGYIPYQTHNEKPKDIDKFLVEQYGNMINASLTGTPYTGSITAAQLKALSAGVQKKIDEQPGYMSQIVNQAQQNVMGLTYMPYDKNDFIKKAQDFSSKEFEMLNKAITNHVNDLGKNLKTSFNGEFQKLSKELVEKNNNTNAGQTAASKTTAEKNTATPSGATDAGERPSFLTEVSNFVKKNIVEKNPALTLADTFLGTMVDKAKKIVNTGKNVATAFSIVNKLTPGKTVSMKINQDNTISARVYKTRETKEAREARETPQQKPPGRSSGRK
jgi:hypothetical protein